MRSPASHFEPALAAVASHTVATWPVGTFIENLVALDDGSFIVSVHNESRLERVGPDGRRTVLAHLPLPGTGLIADGDAVYVAGGAIGAEPGLLWRVDLDSGGVRQCARVPGALFLNGLTAFRQRCVLAVDSLLGVIFEIDLDAGTVDPWFEDPLLSKCSDEPMLPGGNGLKCHGDQVVVTNTDRALVLAIETVDGRAGRIRQLAEALRGDDFAFDVDGNAYFATHIHNSLVRLGADGRRATLAGAAQGMAGATACAFGRAPGDEHALYVTTTGGVILPYEGVVQPARLVRLEVGARGAPLRTLAAAAVSA